MEIPKPQTQAQLFGRYLIGRQPAKRSVDLYVQAVQGVHIHDTDAKLLRLIEKHPRMLGFVDGGLALTDPQSEIRRRLYTMFAILEANPEYVDAFLPQKRSAWYATCMIGVGVRAVMRGVVGALIVKIMRRS